MYLYSLNLSLTFVATKPKAVKMFPVASENVERIGYRDADRTLVIKFRNSPDTYYFADVPKARFTYMKNTNTSVGHYFHTHIKNKFKFTKDGQ